MNSLFTPFYEGFYPWEIFYIEGFSEDMYGSGTYNIVGWFWILSSVLLTLFYYYILSNYGSWFKRGFWFLWVVLTCIINFIAAYVISKNGMADYYQNSDEGSPWGLSEHFSFSMVNVFWTFLLCIILSIAFKYKSIKASRTPF